MMKVEPLPGALRTSMSPPDCLAKPKAWLRPSPVPLPTSLVVKNGSKIDLELVGGDAGAGVRHRDRDEVAGAAG